MVVRVIINGTHLNPYEHWGLKQNPFPRIPVAAPWANAANSILARLEAGPVDNENQLLEIIKDCSPEFIRVCRAEYRMAQVVAFHVSWPD